jgi:hypothetical protein
MGEWERAVLRFAWVSKEKRCYEGLKLEASLRVHVGREAFSCGHGKEIDSGSNALSAVWLTT